MMVDMIELKRRYGCCLLRRAFRYARRETPCLFNDCFFHADYEVRAARLLEQIILDWNRLGQDLEDLGF